MSCWQPYIHAWFVQLSNGGEICGVHIRLLLAILVTYGVTQRNLILSLKIGVLMNTTIL